MKRKLKRKRWLDERAEKIRNKKKKSGMKSNRGYTSVSGLKLNKVNGKIYNAVAPERFSIYENHDITANYFVLILNEIKKKIFHENFYFDFQNVEYVSIESIVYIIAILRNIKTKAYLHYEFQGNFPRSLSAKKVFIESGFLKYVEAKKMRIPKSMDNVQILTGDIVNTKEAKSICDFVKQKGFVSNPDNRVLYNILIELMSNTVQHAYNYDKLSETYLLPAWFIYCEEKNNRLIFNFVDIGDGIPQTINKKFLKDFFLNDSSAILSALNGDFRSETKKEYRGKGLPYLKSCVSNGIIKNFKVMSGKGSCSYVENENLFIKEEYKKEIFGTIFYWEMGKECIE